MDYRDRLQELIDSDEANNYSKLELYDKIKI